MHNNNNIQHTDMIDNMLTNSLIIKYLKKNTNILLNKTVVGQTKINKIISIEKKQQPIIDKKNIHKEKPDFIISQKDKLFWCFYIFLKGFHEYEFINNTHFKVEKDFKISAVEKLNTVKDKLKLMKIKICDVENELSNKLVISTIGLQFLCLLHKINIMYIKNNTFYEIIGDCDKADDDKYYNIILNENNNITMPAIYDDIDKIKSRMANYREKYWKIDNVQKPIKAVSAYTLDELKTICEKLNLDVIKNGKKLIKKDLYQSILTKIS